MEYFNPSGKLVFISILLSLSVFKSSFASPQISPLSSPKNNDSPFVSLLSESSSESEDQEDDLATPFSMAPESSLDHDQSFPPSSNEEPRSEEEEEEEEPSDSDDDNDEDSFSKTDLDNIGNLFSNPNTFTDTNQLTGEVDPKLMKICNSTDHPHLCLISVAPFLKGKTDLMSVIGITMKISKHVAELGLVMARRIVNSPATPRSIATKLSPCLDSYDDALYNFENAMEAFKNGDTGTMNSMLSAVLTDVGDCKDQLTGLRFPSHMAKFSDRLSNMTSNCLAMIDLIHN